MGYFGSALLLSFATFVWFRNDASLRSYTRSTVLNIGFVGLGFLVLPYYLLKSRGLKSGVLAIGVGVFIYLLYGVSTLLGIVLIKVLRPN